MAARKKSPTKQKRTAKPKGSKPRQRSSGSDEKRMRTGGGVGAGAGPGPKGRGDAAFDAAIGSFERRVAKGFFEGAYGNDTREGGNSKKYAKEWYADAEKSDKKRNATMARSKSKRKKK